MSVARFVDASTCAWCGEIVVLVPLTDTHMYLNGQDIGPRNVWKHKITGAVLCANGKSAAWPKEENADADHN